MSRSSHLLFLQGCVVLGSIAELIVRYLLRVLNGRDEPPGVVWGLFERIRSPPPPV